MFRARFLGQVPGPGSWAWTAAWLGILTPKLQKDGRIINLIKGDIVCISEACFSI